MEREARPGTSFLGTLLDDGGGDIGVDVNTQTGTVIFFSQSDVTASIDVSDSRRNARTVTVVIACGTTQNNVFNWQVIVPHLDGNAATGGFLSGDTGTLTSTLSGLIKTTLRPTFPPLIFDPDGTSRQDGVVDPLQIGIDFSVLTQFAAESMAAIETQGDSSRGSLGSTLIDSRGLFTNGETQRIRSNPFSVSFERGGPVGGSLFQANARVIAIGDEILFVDYLVLVTGREGQEG